MTGPGIYGSLSSQNGQETSWLIGNLTMQTVILTGGRGTRLGALTDRLPKGMVEIAGRPFLEHLLAYLQVQGLDEILFCTGYRGEMIEDHFGDGALSGRRIEYSREDTPRGTGGALKLAAWRGKLREEFLLLNGDTFLPADYRRLSRRLAESGDLMILSAHPGPAPGAVPNLAVNGAGKVTALRPSGDPGPFTHLDAGVRAVRRAAVEYCPPGAAFSLEEDLYPRLRDAGKLSAVEVKEKYYDIGTPDRIAIFREYLTGRGLK